MVEVPEIVQQRLGDEIEEAGIVPAVLDYFAPSRKGRLHEVGAALVKYTNLNPEVYAKNYPWEIFAPNILTAGVRYHFCELDSRGLFRSYAMTFGTAGYDGGESVRGLISVPLPDETDFGLLQRQALKLILYIRGKNFRVKKGYPTDELLEDEDIVMAPRINP